MKHRAQSTSFCVRSWFRRPQATAIPAAAPQRRFRHGRAPPAAATTAEAGEQEPVPLHSSVSEKHLLEEAKITALHRLKCNFCKRCGGRMELAVPPGEGDLRHVCSRCSFVDYHNPKMVVGCVVEHEGQVLLCRRAIEPCKGRWTLPAGFQELGESCQEGAVRETWEEAAAAVSIAAPYAHLDIPIIGQAYLFFRGHLAPPFSFSAGPESSEVALFAPDAIPFEELAFSSVAMTLRQWVSDKAAGTYSLRHGVIRKKAGASPFAADAYMFNDSYDMPSDAVVRAP